MTMEAANQIIYPISQNTNGGFNDISAARQQLATFQTAEYVDQHMHWIQPVEALHQVHDMAINSIEAISKKSLILEFGVFEGRTINHIASHFINHEVHGFDSFEGLPEHWRDGFPQGTFKLQALPKVLSNAKLHVGLFSKTLPEFIKTLDDKQVVSYLHIDCDLYSSTATILDLLETRIRTGTVIVFDEYFNYPGWKNGEFKAFQEFIKRTQMKYEYITYNKFHEQVALKITAHNT